MMTKTYRWRLLKGDMLSDPVPHGADWNEFILEDGPYYSEDEAEDALQEYFKKYRKEYDHPTNEEFTLLTVYGDE
jgi:hypothetical protein